MSILRSDRLVALHDLVEACSISARHCTTAAETLSDDPRAAQLRALAGQREAAADFFAERMLAEDDIPPGGPEELDLLQEALVQGKAALTGDAWEELAALCREQEETVLQRAEAAQAKLTKDDEKQRVKDLADDARRQLDSLLGA